MSLEYKPSLGFVETAGLVIAIQVADAMAKAAEVEIISAHKVDGLRVCVICKGDVAACQAAVETGVHPGLFRQLYHRLTRANTPDSVSFRRFLPFSPWLAPASPRLKNQKSLENTSLAGASSFVGAEMCPDKKRPAGNTCRIAKGLDAVWAHFCPSKPCLPLSIDGINE